MWAQTGQKQVRKSAETTNRRRAETLAAKELTDAENQTEEVVENQAKKVPVTMGQLFERFMDNVSSHFKETTHARNKQIMKHLKPFFCDRLVVETRTPDVITYKEVTLPRGKPRGILSAAQKSCAGPCSS